MSEFTFLVAMFAFGSFLLSWVLFWVEFKPFATMFAVMTTVAVGVLVVTGLYGIIQFVAMSMGF